jgi:hypothetical protein
LLANVDIDNCMLMVRPGGKREAVYQAVWADNKDFDQVLISKCMVQVREKYQKMLREKGRWVGGRWRGKGPGERQMEEGGRGRRDVWWSWEGRRGKWKGDYTVSWRIRIFNCIEEVPRFFFPIEFNSAFQISNYLQFNSTPYTI